MPGMSTGTNYISTSLFQGKGFAVMLQHGASFRKKFWKSHIENSSLFWRKGQEGEKGPKKPGICEIKTIRVVHKKAVEGIYSNSLGCSIRVIVQSGFAPSVNSLWNS